MIDKIQTFGDSFMFGADLSDTKDKVGNAGEHSLLTWPALVAKKLKLNYDCRAESGRGNYSIVFKIFQHADKNSLNVINWTWIDRYDYGFNYFGWPNTIRPDDNELSKFYYKNIHTEFDDKIKNLIAVHSAIKYLREANFPFIMTYMDRLMIDDVEGIDILRSQVINDLMTFPGDQTFLEWSRSSGYPESDNWHPLEQAHERAAEYWLPVYEKEISKHITTK